MSNFFYIELALSLALFWGSVFSSSNLIKFFLFNVNKKSEELEETSKTYYLFNLIIGKTLLVFSIFIIFILRNSLSLFHLLVFYLFLLISFSTYKAVEYLKK